MQSDLTYLDKLDKKQYLTIKCVKTKSLIYTQYNIFCTTMEAWKIFAFMREFLINS